MNQNLRQALDSVDTECLRSTLGNLPWLKDHFDEVVSSIPKEWTCVQNVILPFGFRIKCMGVEWRQESQIVAALIWLNHMGIAESRVDPHAAPGARSLIYRRSPVLPDLSRL